MRLLVALAIIIAAFAPATAAGSTATIIDLVRDVCLAQGGNLQLVQATADRAGWRALEREEIASIPFTGIRPGFVTGWAVTEGAAPVWLTLEASGVITADMRERFRAGETVTAPPPGEPAGASRFERRRERTQVCSVRFSGEAVDAVRNGINGLVVLGSPLGAPSLVQDLSRQHGAPATNYFWPRDNQQTNEWRATNYTVTGEGEARRGIVSINQPVPPAV